MNFVIVSPKIASLFLLIWKKGYTVFLTLMLKAIKLLLTFEKFMAKKLLNKETKQSILLRLGFYSNSKCLSQVLFFLLPIIQLFQ